MDICEFLVINGGDVYVKDFWGYILLYWVVYNNYKDVIEVLLMYGSDVILVDKFEFIVL